MKVQILSDLHIDSYVRRGEPKGEIPATDADIIIVAGDTGNGEYGMSWLQQQAARLQKPILTVAGNHEYFHQDVLEFDAALQHWDNFVDAKQSQDMQGVKLLQCDSLDIDNVRILGCTLWTDYQYQATDDTIPAAMQFMRDYKQISAGSVMFSPDISKQIHHKHRQWLLASLQQAYAEGRKCIVITHHSVSPLSVSEKYAHLPSNAAFVSDLSEWMYADWAPALWVHGHTHEAFDYQLGNTRVVVNPRAYPGEVSSTGVYFDWTKVVTV